MTPRLLSLFFLMLLRAWPNHASSHPKLSHFLLPRIANISSAGAEKSLSVTPTLSCYPQDQDPDQGILSEFCICDETVSLPQMTPTPPPAFDNLTASCAYTTIPVSQCYPSWPFSFINISPKPCQTCTSLGFPENKCVSIPNCNPQATSSRLLSSTTEAPSMDRESSNVGSASFPTATGDGTLDPAHAITAAPSRTPIAGLMSNSSLAQSDGCLLQDAYCSLRGPSHSLDGLRDECVLWDTSCSGDRSLATSLFYGGVTSVLMQNKCFFDPSPDCSKSNPPGRVSAFDDVKSWMRSPQCLSEDPTIIDQEGGDEPNVIQEDLFLNQTCCDNCQVAADQVDVYYWSNPHANTSCLSIIGDGNSDLAVGATTDKSGDVYWGCTTWSSGSPLIVSTATLTSLASMTFRSYLFNPWDESPCGNYTASVSSDLKSNITPRGLYPRGHTLIAPNNSVSTLVLGDVTL